MFKSSPQSTTNVTDMHMEEILHNIINFKVFYLFATSVDLLAKSTYEAHKHRTRISHGMTQGHQKFEINRIQRHNYLYIYACIYI